MTGMKFSRLTLGTLLLASFALACSESGDGKNQDAPISLDGGTSQTPDGGSEFSSEDAGFPSSDAGNDPSEPVVSPDSSKCTDLDNVSSVKALLNDVVACLSSSEAKSDQALAKDSAAKFLQAGEKLGGFPLVDGDQATFVFLGESLHSTQAGSDGLFSENGSIFLAGDVNDWAPSEEDELSERAPGLFALTRSVAGGTNRLAYKFKGQSPSGSEVWLADPLSRRVDFDDNGMISLIRGGTDKGHLQILRNVGATSEKIASRALWLYLPPGYDQETSVRYPVLYMHDGNNLFDVRQPRSASETWDVDGVEELELSAGNVAPHIVVGIPNTDRRMEEYTHVQDQDASGEVYGTTGIMGGWGEDYADYVVKTVKPLIDATYRTKLGFSDTAILGSSLGGLISYYIAWKHPDVFKFVGGMSGTFGWGYFMNNARVMDLYGDVANLSARNQVYYLDSGGNYPEGGCADGGSYDALIDEELCDVDRMKAVLVKQGIENFPENPDVFPVTPADANIYHYWQPGARHSESAWNARLYRPLRFFFPKRP